jgi:hypothetical protein
VAIESQAVKTSKSRPSFNCFILEMHGVLSRPSVERLFYGSPNMRGRAQGIFSIATISAVIRLP